MAKYYAIAVLMQIVWSFTPSLSNFIIREIPVELFIAIRWGISGIILMIASLVLKKDIDLSPRMLPRYLLLGMLGYGTSSLCTLYALKLGGVVNFALISSINPLITALLSIVILNEKVHKSYWIAIPLCIIGLLVMVLGKHEVSGSSIALGSAALVLGAYICEALPFVYSKKFGGRQSLLSYMAILQMSASGFMWLGQLLYFKQYQQLASISTATIWAVLYMSIIICCVCYAILYWLLRHIDGHRLAMFDSLYVICGALEGVIFFNDPFNYTMVLGGALLLIALYLANMPAKPKLDPGSGPS